MIIGTLHKAVVTLDRKLHRNLPCCPSTAAGAACRRPRGGACSMPRPAAARQAAAAATAAPS
jgi:hypothetical protein